MTEAFVVTVELSKGIGEAYKTFNESYVVGAGSVSAAEKNACRFARVKYEGRYTPKVKEMTRIGPLVTVKSIAALARSTKRKNAKKKG
jgi:hypothetical protein